MKIDYEEVFRSLPHNDILFAPNDPLFTILDITDAFLKNLGMNREDVVDKPLFTVFPDNVKEGVQNEALLRKHLKTVVNKKEYQAMPIVRYDIPDLEADGFNIHYWSPESYPVLDKDGNTKYVIHVSLDITDLVRKGVHL